MFRTIHDEDGHDLTHNFRPTQPVGDRAVYFVTSLKSGDSLYGLDERPRFDEPSQHINYDSNDDHKHDRLTKSTTPIGIGANDEIASNDDPNAVIDQTNNDITVETTTSRHWKFPKLGRNTGNQLTGSTTMQLTLIGISVILFMTTKY